MIPAKGDFAQFRDDLSRMISVCKLRNRASWWLLR